ncbi:MAG: tetratricopeptide repeat protein [Lachnospiraceae bacterium]|nr:tetratricopeptide repeat protein [Lachnospiraceae bacterium]
MEALTCRCCGGNLEHRGDELVCDSCGTVYQATDDKDDEITRLRNKAIRLRRDEGDYTAAREIYEQILDREPEDAEANWGVVLCQYGILYVEDPATKKQIPTLNRMQETSVYQSSYYQNAIISAGVREREQYQKDAAEIDKIQKEYYAVAAKEKPYDVFISFKQTVEGTDEKTEDFEIARNLYDHFTQKGLRVFFSPVVLKEKFGKYEPIIYAALHSASVMLVVGTSRDHFYANWVRNEWERYLWRMKDEKDLTIIPIYRGMKVRDIPMELAVYQACDYDDSSALSNVYSSVEEIIRNQKNVQQQQADSQTIAKYRKKIFDDLRNQNWESADKFSDEALKAEPNYAEAYLAKIMIERGLCTRDQLENCEEPIETSSYFDTVMKSGDEALKRELSGYEKAIKRRIVERRNELLYRDARQRVSSAGNLREAELAEAQLKRIPISYQDTEECLKECDTLLKTEREKEEPEKESRDSELKGIAVRARKRMLIEAGIALVLFLIAEFGVAMLVPANKNVRAKSLLETGRYEEAYALYEEIGKTDVVVASRCERAQAALNNGDYDLAYSILEPMQDNTEISRMLNTAKYEQAEAYLQKGNYEKAFVLLEAVGTWNEADELLKTEKYNLAETLVEKGELEDAIRYYDELGDYKDSAQNVMDCKRIYATEALSKNDMVLAYRLFSELGDTEAMAQMETEENWLPLTLTEVGATVEFGTYEQDGDQKNGAEPVEWFLVEKQEDRALLVSKYMLDKRPYHNGESGEATNWEQCTLRAWMNNDMYEALFTPEEQERILESSLSVMTEAGYKKDSPRLTIAAGKTTDKVFLLSWDEFMQYSDLFPKLTDNTNYSLMQQDDDTTADLSRCWWLRTMYSASEAYCRDPLQYQSKVNHNAADTVLGICPAVWVDITFESGVAEELGGAEVINNE